MSDGMRGLKGKNVLVTGGTSGIGQAIAVRFAEYGANVAINYLTTPDEATETADKVHACLKQVQQQGVRDVLVQGDVSKEEDVVRMFEDAVDRLGGIDVLINNAGIQISKPSHELSAADFDKVLGVNLRGSFLCAREAIKRFLDAGTPGLDHQHLQRPPADPEAELRRLLGQQGRHAEPDPDAGARVRREQHPRQRDRPRCHRDPNQSGLDRRPGQARDGDGAHPDGARRHVGRDGRA